MASIESRMFYGDNPEIFHSLFEFKIVDVEFTSTNESKEPVIVLKCVNENHVEIDILIQEDGVFVTDPFAVKEDLSPIEAEQGKENDIVPMIEQENIQMAMQGGDMEETNVLLKQILEELKAIREEVTPKKRKKVTQTANIDGKTITECVTCGINSAIQKSIRGTGEED